MECGERMFAVKMRCVATSSRRLGMAFASWFIVFVLEAFCVKDTNQTINQSGSDFYTDGRHMLESLQGVQIKRRPLCVC